MTAAAVKHACFVIVYPRGSKGIAHGYGCRKPAKVERDGYWWCALHDPERVVTKRQEREAKYADLLADMGKRDHEAARDRALAAWARGYFASGKGIGFLYRQDKAWNDLAAIMSDSWKPE